ncbi:hypothetical protein GE21DRAFT_850 [Neurospora crassa]|uniref:Uncharacterized protein n=2 Tax=Neurospora crassa TaxID=5141 RepID=Q7SH70_NEUCR|nr:hypothetical protein NCU02659 [Neurospora crassa OR74A]EAA36196.3 hypothetical protein NCU02659 [Neurospora crassa OR74A]EGZ77842.1 hypothetical protein NEUTE2DRAFT_101162 [Neurospora tetrasperma FGSC 2509]KHE90100.1 hypothetical protein GE21DRAFT_850 [Neurospora crassa]CAE76469.1 putative protein [Neurospora crassa]|eukprot:XP_965432.3 hypothetical protein NCU02659 [Neurospora crassa OR74A]
MDPFNLPIEWALQLLTGVLPDPYLSLARQHLLSPDSAIQSLKRHIMSTIEAFISTLIPIMQPLVERLTAYIYASPDVVILAGVLLLLVMVLQVLSWMRRVLMFFTRLAFTLVFWAGMAAVASWVYRRGVEQSARDATFWLGRASGYGLGIWNFFMTEWQRYEAQDKARGHAKYDRA